MGPNIKPPWPKKLAQLPKYYSTEFALTGKKQSWKASLISTLIVTCWPVDWELWVQDWRPTGCGPSPLLFLLVRLDHKTIRMRRNIGFSRPNFLAQLKDFDFACDLSHSHTWQIQNKTIRLGTRLITLQSYYVDSPQRKVTPSPIYEALLIKTRREPRYHC